MCEWVRGGEGGLMNVCCHDYDMQRLGFLSTMLCKFVQTLPCLHIEHLLQTALVSHRDQLIEIGLLYWNDWNLWNEFISHREKSCGLLDIILCFFETSDWSSLQQKSCACMDGLYIVMCKRKQLTKTTMRSGGRWGRLEIHADTGR